MPRLQGQLLQWLPVRPRTWTLGLESLGRTDVGTVSQINSRLRGGRTGVARWASLVREARATFVFPPRDHTASLVTAHRLLSFPLLQPNSLVPVSPSAAALTLCYISGWTCFPGEGKPFRSLLVEVTA